jgi:surfactin synthase thioesterase subunit
LRDTDAVMSAAADADAFERWVAVPGPRAGVDSRAGALPLVCVPNAGAGAAVYHGWDRLLPEGVTAWPLRLPGRESRLREAASTRAQEVATAAAAAVATRLTEPFALYGHSMGALIAYELACVLRDEHGLHADLLAVSSRPAPHLPRRLPPVHGLSDAEFVAALDRTYQGLPDVLKDSPEMLRFYLPVLRADLTLLETYRHAPREPLLCPIAVFGALDDLTAGEAELRAWAELTRGGSSLHMFEDGGHFFPQTRRQAFADALGGELARLLVP